MWACELNWMVHSIGLRAAESLREDLSVGINCMRSRQACAGNIDRKGFDPALQLR